MLINCVKPVDNPTSYILWEELQIFPSLHLILEGENLNEVYKQTNHGQILGIDSPAAKRYKKINK